MEGCRMTCTFYGCKRTYNSPEALNNHLQDHQKNTDKSLPGKTFLCSHIGCDGSFSNMQQLMEHMRHHYKPNNFFLCESCRAKLRSYRTLLKHLQTCAKVAKNKAVKVETGTAPDADPTNVPPISSDLDSSGPLLGPDVPEDMESMPSLPTNPTPENMTVTQQPPEKHAFANPTPAEPATLPLDTINPASTETLPCQPESPYSSFPPTLSPVNPAFQADVGLQQQQRSPRSGPPSLTASPPLPSPPGSNAVWRKNQGQSFNCRILWEHTRGRYSCLQCGHCTPDRGEMTAHIEAQHKNPGGKVNSDHDTEMGSASLLAKTSLHSENSTYTQL
ncbi:zinc finger protein 414 isoform X1 [Carassius gibelio]|uniref:zinc finger protein 414 isoform X1 n=1 Tax=Carassius gibelio TaxID=101364 RepID=UPI002278CEDD|nr:zinc finger protein 414 isoform X1 [Carassius gibelio]XP_052471159.1 zinc finger protein 414 isoform X1 [Carassius gibelio]XP_052471170.1 zinc finger protein 414 isoform X1 [Carassius gibelio]